MYDFQNLKFYNRRLMRKDVAVYKAGNRASPAILLCKEAERCKNKIKFKFE
jgi:hypothetical protein